PCGSERFRSLRPNHSPRGVTSTEAQITLSSTSGADPGRMCEPDPPPLGLETTKPDQGADITGGQGRSPAQHAPTPAPTLPLHLAEDPRRRPGRDPAGPLIAVAVTGGHSIRVG